MYDYDSRSYSVRRRRSKRRVLIFLAVCLVGFLGFVWFTSTDKREHVQASQSHSAVAGIADFVKHVTHKDEGLKDIVDTQLQGAQGDYAVFI